MFATLQALREATTVTRAAITARQQPEDAELKPTPAPPRKWDFSAPTIVPHPSRSGTGWRETPEGVDYNTRLRSDLDSKGLSDHFWQLVQTNQALNEALKGAFARGFVVAGGFVCNLCCGGSPSWQSDVDFFAPRQTPEVAEAAIFDLVQETTESPHTKHSSLNRTMNCITAMMVDTRNEMHEYQFITRTYDSIAEIIYSFDLAPSAVCWDGDNVYFTPEARFAHETGVFWGDLSKRRLSYESRTIKYFSSKGFGVVLPHWRCARSDTVLALPHLAGQIKLAQADRPVWKAPHLYRHFKEWMRGPQLYSAYICPENYDPEATARVYGSLPYMKRNDLICHNIRRLLADDAFLVWEWDANNRCWNVVLDDNPEEVVNMIVRMLTARYTKAQRHLENFTRVFAGASPTLLALALHYFTLPGARDIPLPDELAKHLYDLADRLLETARETRRVKFAWKTSGEGTDLSSPETIFELHPMTPREWYGDDNYAPTAADAVAHFRSTEAS